MRSLYGAVVAMLVFSESSVLADYFVAKEGTHTAPYTNWVLAATNIYAAVNIATNGSDVLVSDGVYLCSQGEIFITNGITLTSINGFENTVIHGGGTNRCMYLQHSNAVVIGFTLTGGNSSMQTSGMNGCGGGVFLDDGGCVQDCLIISNAGTGSFGGGLCCNSNGMIRRCIIKNNDPGGVYLSYDAIMQSSLLDGNSSGAGGGVWLSHGGLVENCTIVRNTADEFGGGVYCSVTGEVRNSIVVSNNARIHRNIHNRYQGVFSHVCTWPPIEGDHNISTDPEFVDFSGQDYSLRVGSACVDTGTNASWMGTSFDLNSNERIKGDVVDLGAYELSDGELSCNIRTEQSEGFSPLTGVFEASVGGTNVAGLYFNWAFSGGVLMQTGGYDCAVVTNTFPTCGVYSVTLTVSNVAGEIAERFRTDWIKVGLPKVYVSLDGGHVFPYSNWLHSATSIQAAVDSGVDGTRVVVTNGVYLVEEQICIDKGILLESVNGPNHTIIEGAGSNRCVKLWHCNAVLNGFTVKHGKADVGGGVYCGEGSSLQSCRVVSNCTYTTGLSGGGVYCIEGSEVLDSEISYNCASLEGGGIAVVCGGVVSNCLVQLNRADGGGRGGGISLYDGGTITLCAIAGNFAEQAGGGLCSSYGNPLIERCRIYENATYGSGTGFQGGGGIAVRYDRAVIRNCVINNNTNSGDSGGIDGELSVMSIQNCTIAMNSGYQVTHYFDSSLVENCILYPSRYYSDGYGGALPTYRYCCIDQDPLFVDELSGDFHLRPSSPCIDSGTNLSVFADDLNGFARPYDGNGDGTNLYDIGAYEYSPWNQDSDGDGLIDAVELFDYGSDPENCDSDGDMVGDGGEVVAGTGLLDDQSFPEVADFSSARIISSNSIRNAGFEDAAVSPGYAACWKWGEPDAHGDVWGSGYRTDWTNCPMDSNGAWVATIQGQWAGSGSNGGWWQEVPAQAGANYRFGAWFWADDGNPYGPWTARVQNIKLEFFTGTNTGVKLLGAVTNELKNISQEWSYRSVEAKAPATVDWVRVVVNAEDIGNDGSFLFDACELGVLQSLNLNLGRVISWDSCTGRTYTVMSTADFEYWTNVYEVVGDGTRQSYTSSVAQSLECLRVLISLED